MLNRFLIKIELYYIPNLVFCLLGFFHSHFHFGITKVEVMDIDSDELNQENLNQTVDNSLVSDQEEPATVAAATAKAKAVVKKSQKKVKKAKSAKKQTEMSTDSDPDFEPEPEPSTSNDEDQQVSTRLRTRNRSKSTKNSS